ncbi:MAG: DUF4194 domain-containing protein [Anaerolineae bacterium]|nr:DUF4194 domain-containing protein [Anaerolineae bacterium]
MPFTTETVLETTNMPDKAQREIPRVMNRLLGQTFLYQDKDDEKDDYYLVYRHRQVFTALFALAGFTLLHDDYHRIFQIVSEFGYCREHYKLNESLMIVVLRKLYEEQTEQLSLAQDPVVTIGDIREEYRTITGQERALGVGEYDGLLRRMRSLGLIELLDGRTLDVHDSEARLRLRGSIKMILPVQTAEDMEAWLRRYQKK